MVNFNQLEMLREQLTNTDLEILYLLKRRLATVKKIAKYKKENGLEIYQPDREREVFANLSSRARELGLNENLVQNLFDLIVEESKIEQNKVVNK